MTTQTLAQQFAAEYARGVVPAMLRAIGAARRDTRLILAGVLAITYPHQATFLAAVDGIGVLGWIIPAVVDLAMLRMLGIVQTTGMRRPARRAALVMTAALGLLSAAVNVAAPAAPAARAIFGVLVLVAVGVKFVTALVGPDFAAIESAETIAAAAVPRTGRTCEAGCRCGKHNRRPNRKPRQLRAPRIPTYAAAAVLAERTAAPSSPAPAGR